MRTLTIAIAALGLAACSDEQSTANLAPTLKSGTSGSSSASPQAAKSESRTFRDWYAVCDNGNLCSAYTGGETGWILVQMEAGPDGQPTVRMGMWADQGDTSKAPIIITIGGQRHATTRDFDDASSAVLRGPDARAAFSDLAVARTVSLTSGGQTVDLPIAGSSASLLWFDERQGRLDTTTALVRKGAKPAAAVSVAPALPTIVAAPAVSQAGFATSRETVDGEVLTHPVLPASLLAIPVVKRCREDTRMNEYLTNAMTAARLNASTELWGIPCSSRAWRCSRTPKQGPRRVTMTKTSGS